MLVDTENRALLIFLELISLIPITAGEHKYSTLPACFDIITFPLTRMDLLSVQITASNRTEMHFSPERETRSEFTAPQSHPSFMS